MPIKDLNHYEKLGVSETATADDIKRAYRQKATETHPDKGGDTAEFAKVAHAYEVLKDPERKLLYDATGRDSRTPIEIELQGHLIHAFSQVLAMPDHTEIVATVRKGFKIALSEMAKAEKQIKADRKAAQAKRKKVKTTAAVNVVHIIIDQQLREIDAHLEGLKHEAKIANECLKSLETYSDELKKAEPIMWEPSSFNFEIRISEVT